jgi:hypothetical protein
MRAARASSLLVCVTVASFAGCGADDNRQSKADAEIAAAIRQSAAQHEKERRRQERDAVKKQNTRTTVVQGGDALPAGSAEIDGTAAPAAGTAHGLLSAADRASFSRLGAQLAGEEGVAVTTLGRGRAVSRAGTLRGGVAWSTAKLPVAMAAISAGVGAQSDLEQAITASDNAAAERLWSALGDGETAAAAATEQVRAAGDARTVIEGRRLRAGYTAFGQTAWPLSDQARFVAGMACADSGPDVLGLMNNVVSGQRWGLGSTGNDAQFKGGWGPGVSPGSGGGWLERQVGVTTIKGRPIAVAIATTAGDHGTGTQNLTAIARWVVTHVDVSGAPRQAAC